MLEGAIGLGERVTRADHRPRIDPPGGRRLQPYVDRVQMNADFRRLAAGLTGVRQVGKLGLSDVELAQAQPVLPVPVGLAMWGEL